MLNILKNCPDLFFFGILLNYILTWFILYFINLSPYKKYCHYKWHGTYIPGATISAVYAIYIIRLAR